jgi:hypothetical protein
LSWGCLSFIQAKTDRIVPSLMLHIEFQVKDEPKMVFRMAEYHIMLLRRYELPVQQYVIYIGAGKPTMRHYIHLGPLFALGFLFLTFFP